MLGISDGREEEARKKGQGHFTEGGELGRLAMARRLEIPTEDSACASVRGCGSSIECKGECGHALVMLK
jgi:hypothetical protein